MISDNLKIDFGDLKKQTQEELANQLRVCYKEQAKLDDLLYYLPVGYIKNINTFIKMRDYYRIVLSQIAQHEEVLNKMFKGE